MSQARRHPWPWFVGGLFVLAGAAGLSALSHRFVWGEGHAERPIDAAVALQSLVGVGFLFGAAYGVHFRHRAPLGWIVAVGLGARLVLLPSALIQEVDCYRYVLDGTATAHGVNPFRHAPADVADEAAGAFGRAVRSPEAARVLERINYPGLRTIYPPLAQAAFAAGAVATPWSWMGQRVVFLAFDVAVMALLWMALPRLGRPRALVAFWAWNPIVIKEVANSAHLDSLPALVVLALCLATAGAAARPSFRRAVGVGLLLAGGFLSKLYPLVLAPLCAGALARGRRPALRVVVFAVVAAVASALALAPFLTVGVERLTEGLRAYSAEWSRNEGAYALIAAVAPRPRLVASALTALVALACGAWLWRTRRPTDATVDAFQLALLAWFLFLPAPFPWYSLALLAVCALRPRPWAFALSVSFALYYLLFLIDYRGLPEWWEWTVLAVEHGVVWLALAATLARGAWARRRIDPCGGGAAASV